MKQLTLNPDLYDQLQLACRRGLPGGLPGGKVIIANPGISMTGVYRPNPLDLRMRSKLDIVTFGEAYRVCCPWCGDTRHRLYVNHRWGVYDPVTGSRNFGLLKCFNENCHSKDGFVDEFKGRLSVLPNMLAGNAQATVAAVTDETVAVPLPGNLIPLRELPDNHPGVVFLRNKGFNAKKLSDNFGVGWCDHSQTRSARHRIVVPIRKNNTVVGWQARFVDENGSGSTTGRYHCANPFCESIFSHLSDTPPAACPSCASTSVSPVRKWYTAPGMRTGSCMLNYDVARTYNYIILTEGPLDVFRTGSPTQSETPGPAVAIFNHKLSAGHLSMLQPFQQNKKGIIFMMFDQDVWASTERQFLSLYPLFGDKLVPVQLPEDQDPGDMDHKDIWACLRNSARALNVTVEF